MPVYIKKQYNNVIYTKGDYVTAIRTSVSQRFSVVEMKQSNFLNFDALQKSIVNRKPKNIKFIDARKLIFDSQYQEGYAISTHYQVNDLNTNLVRLQRGKKTYSPSVFNLTNQLLAPKYCKLLPITKEKRKDLTDLTELMPRTAASYYTSLLEKVETHNSKIEDESFDETDQVIEYTS